MTDKALGNYRQHFGNRSKLKIIQNGIDIQKLNNASANRLETRQTIFRTNDETIFLQVGRFSQTKQQHLSISAFIQAYKQDKISKSKLFFAGLIEDKEYFLELKKVVSDASLQESIIFLGPRSDIPNLLSAADVYVMPSLREAHSIAFLEALSSGITVIASDIKAFERGKQFPGVFVLQPENTQIFSNMISECSKQSSISRWERDMSEFSIKNSADAYLKVFNILLKR
ncbi:MAG: glycosyltransferase family 4 protein [Cyanobacteria bacterium J06649_11]